MTDDILTQSKLKELLHYNPDTGVFTRLKSQHARFIGTEAGADREGYRVIKIGQKGYRAHRLAWLYMTGKFPSDEIDHINRNGLDNRFENIREADRTLNNRNKDTYANNTSGHKGISWHKKRKRWNVEIGGKQTSRHVGTFKHLAEAVIAREKAEREIWQS